MKILLATAAVVSLASAFVEMGITKQSKPHRRQHGSAPSVLSKRAIIEEAVMNIQPWVEGGGFYMNVSVGTPGQVMTVALSTDSGVTFFNAQNSSSCLGPSFERLDGYGDRLCAGGSFQRNFSSTYELEAFHGFNYTVHGQWVADGDLGTDIIQLGDIQVTNMKFGVAQGNWDATGSVGLGYGLNYDVATTSPRGSLIDQLQASGAIKSKTFALLLRHTHADTGSIIFGGMDLDRVSGKIVTIDYLASNTNWIPTYDSTNLALKGVTQPLIAITDVEVVYANGTQVSLYKDGDVSGQADDSLPSVLEAASPWWSVSQDVYNAMAPLIPGLHASSGVVSCEAGNQDINIAITFAGRVTIDVPLQDLILPIFDPVTNVQNTTSSGLPFCWLAVYPSNGSLSAPYVIGNSVMQSMYLVFDLDNAQISIARATDGSCNDSGCGDIVEIPAGPNGISSVLAQDYITTVTVLTAPENTGLVKTLISASGAAESGVHVVHKTTPGVGTASGTAALPSHAIGQELSILSSGTLVTDAGSSTTSHGTVTGSTGTSTSKAAAHRLHTGIIWLDAPILSGLICTATVIFVVALLL